ncbi:hypothetical protein [Pseudomonas sp. GWSMS-1]|uniref:hypothetical protein n=1 Tax=Pseudomonas sp. GWSMS-1 TaxID=3308997 RepID=UPI003CF7E50E
MSDYLKDGSERIIKTVRLKMNNNFIRQYEELQSTDKPSLSFLMNDLLESWLVTQQLKSEFAKLNSQ